jgi:hypothetical protein
VAKRNTGRRGTRKRRPPSQPRRDGATAVADSSADDPVQGASATARGAPARPRRERRPSDSSAGSSSYRDPGSFGERPQSLWHPLPLSELLILVGAIGTVVGIRRGVSHGGPVLIAGVAAVVIGTVEVSLREHLSGYRSHTIMLALLPVIVLHSVVVLAVAAATTVPPLLNVAMLAVDVAVFAFLYKLLRARFLDARRERVFLAKRG